MSKGDFVAVRKLQNLNIDCTIITHLSYPCSTVTLSQVHQQQFDIVAVDIEVKGPSELLFLLLWHFYDIASVYRGFFENQWKGLITAMHACLN